MSGTPKTNRQLKEARRDERDLAVRVAISRYHSNLYQFLEGRAEVVATGLKFVYRNNHTWLAVATGYRRDDGTLMVCFGAGDDIWASIAGLNGSIAARKWREDKPWSGFEG